MGFSDGEGDGGNEAEWDKSSNASSSSSSSASSNKSKSSKNSKSTNSSKSAKSSKASDGDGKDSELPDPPPAVRPGDDSPSSPPPGTTVAARPRLGRMGRQILLNPLMMPGMQRPMMMPGMQPPMMPGGMMRPMMPGMGPPMPGQMMPSTPMLCSMAASNMAAANSNGANQMGGASNARGASGTSTKNNDYVTTPRIISNPTMGAQMEMMRAAKLPRMEPVVEDPLARRKSFREKLVKLYSQVNPKRLGDIDNLLDKYEGREDKLLMGVLDKYECAAVKKNKKENSRDCDFRSGAAKVDGSPERGSNKRQLESRSESPRSKRTPEDKMRDFYKKRIKKIYKDHNPEKLDGLDALLDKYRGKERDVWLSICDKYAVRPE